VLVEPNRRVQFSPWNEHEESLVASPMRQGELGIPANEVAVEKQVDVERSARPTRAAPTPGGVLERFAEGEQPLR
jgi:hypothetical protein